MPDLLSLIINSAGLVLDSHTSSSGVRFDWAQTLITEVIAFAILVPILFYIWRYMNAKLDQNAHDFREMRAEHKNDITHLREQYTKDLSDMHTKLIECESARNLAIGQNEQMAVRVTEQSNRIEEQSRRIEEQSRRIEEQAMHIGNLEQRLMTVEQNGHSKPAPRTRSRARKTT